MWQVRCTNKKLYDDFHVKTDRWFLTPAVREGTALVYNTKSCSSRKNSFLVSRTIFQRRQWHPTPVLLPGKSHGQRSLVGWSPWGHSESDTTERLPFPFSLSCIREGNGNPLQYSCLENPRDRGASWASVCGVAQSQTGEKRLSSSSSSSSSRTIFRWYPQHVEINKLPLKAEYLRWEMKYLDSFKHENFC